MTTAWIAEESPLRHVLALAFLLALAVPLPAQSTGKSSLSDSQIKSEIVKQSIASYVGSCPCPFNTDRAGRRCGRRSAYSRPGGAAALCYAADVSALMVADYR